jgi:hypothetical protein
LYIAVSIFVAIALSQVAWLSASSTINTFGLVQQVRVSEERINIFAWRALIEVAQVIEFGNIFIHV